MLRILSLLLILISSSIVTSCEDRNFMRGVTFENRTTLRLTLYSKILAPGYDQEFKRDISIGPRQTTTALSIVAYPEALQFKDDTGRVVFEITVSRDDLEKMGWRIVITDQTLAPTPIAEVVPP